MPSALEVTVTAPIASFRNPLYPGLQIGLPCPPPSTVAGMLAAAAGGWAHVPTQTRFAMTFRAAGQGVDLETYHPLATPGTPTNATIKDRDFLAHITLTLWLTDDLEFWTGVLRRPVWPLHLGRSQDLVALSARQVELTPSGGVQGHAVVPDGIANPVGTALRLTTIVSEDRARTQWDSYRYGATGPQAAIDTRLATEQGQAVALLPPVHPANLAAGTFT